MLAFDQTGQQLAAKTMRVLMAANEDGVVETDADGRGRLLRMASVRMFSASSAEPG